jgi:hypothetical protein
MNPRVNHTECHAMNERLQSMIADYWKKHGFEPPSFFPSLEPLGSGGRTIPTFYSDMVNGLPMWRKRRQRRV